MSDFMNKIYEEISQADSLEAFQIAVLKCVEKMNEEGLVEAAVKLKQLSKVQENLFSKMATKENLRTSKEKVLDFLYFQAYGKEKLTEKEALKIVELLLENFHLYCKFLYKADIHGKCSNKLKEHLRQLEIENEYDLQRFMYPLILSIFNDARLEENEDTGHHTVRKDIVIDSFDIVIELKCTRETMNERALSEEIAADIVHYGSKHLFFYIYDKGEVIRNVKCFKDTYEQKGIAGKDIKVKVFQEQEL